MKKEIKDLKDNLSFVPMSQMHGLVPIVKIIITFTCLIRLSENEVGRRALVIYRVFKELA